VVVVGNTKGNECNHKLKSKLLPRFHEDLIGRARPHRDPNFLIFFFALCLDCLLCFRQREPFHDIIMYFCHFRHNGTRCPLFPSPRSINQSINHRKSCLFVLFYFLPSSPSYDAESLTHSLTRLLSERYGTARRHKGGFLPSFFLF